MTDSHLVLVANAKDGSISTFRLTEGTLDRLAVTDGLTGCSTFAVDADRDLVYAGVKGASKNDPSRILTLSLDRASGRLTPQSSRDLEGGGMNYLALTRDGAGLLGASYSGGFGISSPIVDGVVGEPVSRIEFPNLHSVLPSADGRFAYFVSLGADLVAQYALADDLALVPLDPATVAAPEGSGPRHLVLSDAQDAVYVLTEFSGEVLHYARDTETGTLSLQGATTAYDTTLGLGHSEFGADPMANHFIWGADLHLADGGRLLWASERTESTLGAVSIADDGTVSAPEIFFETEPQPRGFAVSPDGAYLVTAGERSTTVSLYSVHGSSVVLLQQAKTGNGANWVRFV
ncbi:MULTISPECIES: lactonase family protein [unclassified Microbacterium]|uniref:lactonase family protein n=1 Tax=unclassified Microbacterium TaxID=2609290 RepID=UPI00214AA67A|nr:MULTISPECIES: lactonase family protein [unclassified Microbacterium]MCR2783934.1 lactonase family protein [Microbacterium sp. zg.B96]WIM15222.1 lactonase family protein [Microbacterium sp. zg-B96]